MTHASCEPRSEEYQSESGIMRHSITSLPSIINIHANTDESHHWSQLPEFYWSVASLPYGVNKISNRWLIYKFIVTL